MEEVGSAVSPIEAVNELVEISGQMPTAHAVKGTSQPAFQVRKGGVNPREHFVSVLP